MDMRGQAQTGAEKGGKWEVGNEMVGETPGGQALLLIKFGSG